MKRADILRTISRHLGDRQLVWFGTRGDDISVAADIPQFGAAYSIIGTCQLRTTFHTGSYEDLAGFRPDLDEFDIDAEPESEAMTSLRRTLLGILANPSALFTYRPSTFISAICFARQDRCQYLGMFKDHQSAFEHKPWVESSIAPLGLARVPWTYAAVEDLPDVLRLLKRGPVMLRRSRSSGGVGLTRVDEPAQLLTLWPAEAGAYVSVAPFISGGVPVNVGGVVWRDGVTVHHASVQLIGVEGCTNRPFGYCGNDFGAIRNVEPKTLDQIDANVQAIGAWLGSMGFRGAFGVDFLVKDDVPLFVEVNPRFQGSTAASCRLSVEQEESCLITEHLAANFGLPAPAGVSLRVQRDRSGLLSQLVIHRPDGIPDDDLAVTALTDMISRDVPGAFIDVVARPDLTIGPAATCARVMVRDRITSTGFDLVGSLRVVVDRWHPVEGVPAPAAKKSGEAVSADG